MVKSILRPLTKLAFFFLPLAANAQDYPIQPVAFTRVRLSDNFWEPKLQVNARMTIPYVLKKCRETGRIDNFLMAAGKKKTGKLTEFPFDDTDLYKVIEGASYSLQVNPDAQLSAQLDTLIGIIAGAQEPDGYLYTFRTSHPEHPHEWIGTKRWEKEEDLSHELYNAGHLYESAVAHYQATGKKTLLNIALKNADLLVKDFGYGKVQAYPGHQIVEIGLVKLYRVTGQKKYLDLAKFFLDVRGPGGNSYNQADKKPADQHQARRPSAAIAPASEWISANSAPPTMRMRIMEAWRTGTTATTRPNCAPSWSSSASSQGLPSIRSHRSSLSTLQRNSARSISGGAPSSGANRTRSTGLISSAKRSRVAARKSPSSPTVASAMSSRMGSPSRVTT